MVGGMISRSTDQVDSEILGSLLSFSTGKDISVLAHQVNLAHLVFVCRVLPRQWSVAAPSTVLTFSPSACARVHSKAAFFLLH